MKTKIITLESHDDLISVRDKLSWAKTPRILLVWPKYEKVSLRLLDLKVLQRHADSLGAQLGLVTRRMNVRRDAESLGMPVFKTTSAAQKDAWGESAIRVQRTPKPPRRDLREKRDEAHLKESAWRTSLLGRLAAFTAGVAAVLILAGLFVPRAAVTLNPEAQAASIVIPVSASPENTSVSLSGSIPLKAITIITSAQKTVPVTSRISIPKTKASGIAQFTNSGADEIIIPAGTVVATNTLARFATLNEVKLPAGENGIVEVKVEALEAGQAGNVNAGDISIIDGSLGLTLTVNNPEPTVGGEDASVTGATEEDRNALHEALLEELKTIADTEARAQLESADLLLADTLELKAIQNEEYSPSLGEAGDSLSLSIQAEYEARYILAEDLNTLAASSLAASIPAEFSANGEMTFSLLDKPVTDSSGVAHFKLQATQPTLRKINISQVHTILRGRNAKAAASEMKELFSLQNEPQIVITPSWWKWLPLIPFNISVKVE